MYLKRNGVKYNYLKFKSLIELMKHIAKNWPTISGRYHTGNENSPVAVCTLFSLDLLEKIPRDNIAIIGKVVTENIGMERIIKNTVSNPKIRFLLICGEEPKGHFVGQAFNCLIDKGLADDGRIIDALGP